VAWIVPSGALDDDPGERPARNVYFGSRPGWYVGAGELPVFEEEPKG